MLKKLDKYLLAILAFFLLIHYTNLLPAGTDGMVLFVLSVIGTIPVLISAFTKLKSRKISVDLLASIALVASLLTREWASAIFINMMLASARLFGYYTESRARAAINSLLKLRPETVKIKKDGQIIKVPAKKVAVGDMVVVESGDRLAVDGIIEEGEASVDQSSLTGESVPVEKFKGDEVFSSTLAVSGSLIVKTTKVGKDTTLEKIIELVESSQSEKADIQTTADKFASWYIGLTLIASVSVYVIFQDLRLLLSLLLVTCADDIAVAVPLAFLAAIGYAARRGVIIKGGAYLQGLADIRTLILDKTGTITRGKFFVENITPFGDFSKNDLLIFSGIAESVSEHPIAKSIARYVAQSKILFKEPEEFRELPGKGITALYKEKEIIAGKTSFLKEKGVQMSAAEESSIQKAQENGGTVTIIAYDKKPAGFISCADEVRPHVKSTIQKIKKLGVEKIIMLTGDNDRVAKRISGEVGITEYHAGLLPENKVDYVRKNLNKNKKLAMVGDGVNDAASLALADVGIAMGAIGSDASIEAADIALMKDDFAEIPEAMELSLYTRKIANQDFFIWGITNAIGLVLVLVRIIGPEGSSAYNFVTDFFPLMNSLRLFNLHRKLK